MPHIQYDYREIEPGHYFYFEGRVFQSQENGFRQVPSQEPVNGAYNTNAIAIQSYIEWLESEQGMDPGDIAVNPLEFDPTPQHIEFYGSGDGVDLSNAPSSISIEQIQPYNFGQLYNKKPSNTEKQLDAEYGKTLHAMYENLSAFRSDLLKNFKAGGAASTAMTAFANKYEQAIEFLADQQRKSKLYMVEWEKVNERYRETNAERIQYAQALEELKARHFDIGQFSKYCDSLYKTVAAPGPKIEQMTDLPKLTDYMYSQIIRSQNTEPEVP